MARLSTVNAKNYLEKAANLWSAIRKKLADKDLTELGMEIRNEYGHCTVWANRDVYGRFALMNSVTISDPGVAALEIFKEVVYSAGNYIKD